MSGVLWLLIIPVLLYVAIGHELAANRRKRLWQHHDKGIEFMER